MTPRAPPLLAVLGTALLLTASIPARAQAADTALAEQLFEDGQRLMAEGKLDDACPKLAESHRIDPKLGTLLNLATCHEQQRKLAAAWSEFTDAIVLAERAHRTDRVDFAKKHLATLDRAIARVRLAPYAPLPDDVVVRLDGREMHAIAGTSFPIDPGTHTVEESAPGKQTWTTSFEATAGAESRLDLPALTAEPTGGNAGPPPGPRPSTRGESMPDVSTTSSRRTVGFVVGGAGALGLAVGSVFGILALSKESAAKSLCPDPACPTQAGVDAHDAARSYAAVSTVSLVAGALMAGAGAVLVLTAPKGRVAAWLRPGARDVAFGAAW